MKQFLNTREAAEFLDVNEKMVYHLISEKGLPASKVTGKWRFPLDLVEKWMEAGVVNHPEPHGFIRAPGLLVFAGSHDLLLEKALGLYNRLHPEFTAAFGNVGSLAGIRALRRGHCHVAASHLMQEDETEYNFDFAAREFGADLPAVVNLSRREQGLLVAAGNPHGLRFVGDLGRSGLTVANRPGGTGTRLLFDRELEKAGIRGKDLSGYGREVRSHMDAGLEVLSGRADAVCAIRPVAALLGLSFLPLRWERYDLLIPKERFFDKSIQLFLGLLHEKEFLDSVKTLSGYDLSLCGKMVYPRESKTPSPQNP